MQEFRLPHETVRIGDAELEAIRKSVVARLAAEDDEIHRALKEELQNSIAVVGPEDTRLGPWVLTERGDQLALVRLPPRAAMNYIFVAKLAHQDGEWVVTDFFQERMRGR